MVHCVETAILLASTGADSTVVAAGLLHDTLDDSSMDQARLRVLAGNEIESLVSGVSDSYICLDVDPGVGNAVCGVSEED